MEMIGGYRILRLLGEGPRARVLLGVAARQSDGGADVAGDRVAALKVYRDAVPLSSVDTEIEALARVSHRHVVELRDLATAPDGRPVLIFPRLGAPELSRPDLAKMVEKPGGLEVGEIVTALAPIVGAVQQLHRVGVAHGGIRLSSIMIDDAGAPVLCGFGRASIIGELPDSGDERSLSDAELSAHPAALDDVGRVAGLVSELFDSLPRLGAQGRRVAELSAWLADADMSQAPSVFLAELEDRLFDLAPAVALDVAGDAEVGRDGDQWGPDETTDRHAPARFSLDLLAARDPERSPVVAIKPVARASASKPHLAGPLARMFAERLDDHPLELVRTRLATMLAPVRAPVWVAGGCGAVALVVALMVLGGSGGSARGDAETSAHATAPTSAPAPSSKSALSCKPAPSSEPAPSSKPAPSCKPAPSGAPASAPASTPRSTAEATASPTPKEDAAAISGLDPVAATAALLRKRATCFVGRSESCLRSVDDAGSSAFDSDRGALASLGAEEPVPESLSLTAGRPELGERLGDSAIIRLRATGAETGDAGETAPASILVVRSEAGWRIRDLAVVASGGG